jgi:hypothetical protein
MAIVLDGTANTVTPLNGALGATTPSTVVATTVKAATTIAVGNATPSASGAGITFPATASLSSNANTLDDYEEGTWTPNQGAGLTVTGTYSSYGTYTKIGNIVYVTSRQAASTITVSSATGVICTNLPFSVLSTEPGNSWGGISNISGTVAGVINASPSGVYNNGTTIPSTASIYFSVTYQTAS